MRIQLRGNGRDTRIGATFERLEGRQLFSASMGDGMAPVVDTGPALVAHLGTKTAVTVDGTYSGTLKTKKTTTTLTLTLTDTNGVLTGTLSTGTLPTPVALTGSVKGHHVTFTVTENGTVFTARGAANKDGSRVAGSFGGGTGKSGSHGVFTAALG